jgi:prophage regulatory protein
MESYSVTEKFLSVRQVMEIVGASSTTLWRWQRDGKFPRRRTLGPSKVAWLESEVMEWIRTRPTANT